MLTELSRTTLLLVAIFIYRSVLSEMVPPTHEEDRFAKFILAHHCGPEPTAAKCCDVKYQETGLIPIRKTTLEAVASELRQGFLSFDCMKAPSDDSDRIVHRNHFLICPSKSYMKLKAVDFSDENRIRLQLEDGEIGVNAICEGEAMVEQSHRPPNNFALGNQFRLFWHVIPVDGVSKLSVFFINQTAKLYPEAINWLQENYGFEPSNPLERRRPHENTLIAVERGIQAQELRGPHEFGPPLIEFGNGVVHFFSLTDPMTATSSSGKH